MSLRYFLATKFDQLHQNHKYSSSSETGEPSCPSSPNPVYMLEMLVEHPLAE
jgi:hypothetical protein